MEKLLLGDPQALWRTLLIGIAAYGLLIVFLRLSGKRTLTKMNAFDLVVTVALGSTLATILLDRDVALAQGALALGLLVVLQFVITWSSVRIGWIRRLVTGEPTLLASHGRMHEAALRRTRVTRAEVLAAVRAAGICELADAGAVVLETDGSVSVLREAAGERSALADVDGVDADADAAVRR